MLVSEVGFIAKKNAIIYSRDVRRQQRLRILKFWFLPWAEHTSAAQRKRIRPEEAAAMIALHPISPVWQLSVTAPQSLLNILTHTYPQQHTPIQSHEALGSNTCWNIPDELHSDKSFDSTFYCTHTHTHYDWHHSVTVEHCTLTVRRLWVWTLCHPCFFHLWGLRVLSVSAWVPHHQKHVF